MELLDKLLHRKTDTEKKVPEDTKYKPAFQRVVDTNKNYLYTSVRVRVFLGDIEKDLVIKIRNQDLAATDICNAIVDQLNIPRKFASLFRLWTFGKDLELQLDPEQQMTDLLLKWHIIMLQYTHYTEAATANSPINRYFFVYKRAAIQPKSNDQKALNSRVVVKLLYGEAKRNFLNNRYVVSADEEYKFAAYQLFNRYGEYNKTSEPKLSADLETFYKILPTDYKITSTTVSKIIGEYKKLPVNFDSSSEFLRQAISLPVYGSCFFPVCEERPPLGYFEHRVQRWLVGVNELGISILDPIKKKYVKIFIWETISWQNSPLHITIYCTEKKFDEPVLTKLLSPQSPMIDNVATRAKYVWAKEVLKDHMNYSLETHNIDIVLSNENLPSNVPFLKPTNEHSKFEEKTDLRSKKFTSVSRRVKKTTPKLTLGRIWEMIMSPMAIKKPGEEPYDIDDGMSDIGSVQQLNLVV